MIRQVFSVRNAKGEFFNPPFISHTKGSAERTFQKLVNDPQSDINQFPEDYDLYYVGDFDDTKGVMLPLDTPEHLVKAVMLHGKQN